jgi:2-hydroxychromene-2-carboxylate isomerase
VIFYINFASLDCWLTLPPLQRLIDMTGVDIEFRPMTGSLGNVVSGAKPGEDDPLAEYKARRARARRMAADREYERVCEMLELDPAAGKREIDPRWLSLGLQYALRAGADPLIYAEAAFNTTYREAGDVETMQGIADLLMRLDIDVSEWPDFADANLASYDNLADDLLEAGILSAPAFLIEDEVFHGREHLPLLTWMQTGRQGPPPV